MRNTTHTPGPWFIDGMGNDPFCLAITAGELTDGPEFQRESKVAEVHTMEDARLIAAAPDLLGACKTALRYLLANVPKGNVRAIFDQLNAHACVCKSIRAAIDQVEGR
jgi:hypothetical protein